MSQKVRERDRYIERVIERERERVCVCVFMTMRDIEKWNAKRKHS